jgi:hypothetical protein
MRKGVAGARFARGAALLATLASAGLASCGSSSHRTDADQIRAIERERLRGLVMANVEVARKLHAENFQLTTPLGDVYSKDRYLGAIASGEIDYLVWKPGPIDARVDGNSAVIRYQSQQDLLFQGRHVGLGRYRHTDWYEKRNGQWQVVRSQAIATR